MRGIYVPALRINGRNLPSNLAFVGYAEAKAYALIMCAAEPHGHPIVNIFTLYEPGEYIEGHDPDDDELGHILSGDRSGQVGI